MRKRAVSRLTEIRRDLNAGAILILERFDGSRDLINAVRTGKQSEALEVETIGGWEVLTGNVHKFDDLRRAQQFLFERSAKKAA